MRKNKAFQNKHNITISSYYLNKINFHNHYTEGNWVYVNKNVHKPVCMLPSAGQKLEPFLLKNMKTNVSETQTGL